MSIFSNHDFLYNKQPLTSDQNRDEHFLIEVPGNWVPESDLIIYGLLNSSMSDQFYKLRENTRFNSHDIYLNTSYFESPDLVRYLASKDDTLADLSESFIIDAIGTAIKQYLYIPANETMLRHAIIEASYFKFMKSVTLIYPWPIRNVDRQYLNSIIPKTVAHKFNIVFSYNLLEFLQSTEVKGMNHHFTSIVLNSLEDLEELIDNPNQYHVNDTFFLLRNHSGNVSMEMIPDPKNPEKMVPQFEEKGTLEILQKLVDIKTGLPKTQMRFARYEPLLFQDAKPDPRNFQIGR